jgi:hypothetical protein
MNSARLLSGRAQQLANCLKNAVVLSVTELPSCDTSAVTTDEVWVLTQSLPMSLRGNSRRLLDRVSGFVGTFCLAKHPGRVFVVTSVGVGYNGCELVCSVNRYDTAIRIACVDCFRLPSTRRYCPTLN